MIPEVTALDPFDLPEWLGEGTVAWVPDTGVRRRALVPGTLHHHGHHHEHHDGHHDGHQQRHAEDPAPQKLPCDLLAADAAYPQPVVDQAARVAAHQAWQYGQLYLGEREGRLTLLVPGHELSADLALVVLGRLARSVGARPDAFWVTLRLSDAE